MMHPLQESLGKISVLNNAIIIINIMSIRLLFFFRSPSLTVIVHPSAINSNLTLIETTVAGSQTGVQTGTYIVGII